VYRASCIRKEQRDLKIWFLCCSNNITSPFTSKLTIITKEGDAVNHVTWAQRKWKQQWIIQSTGDRQRLCDVARYVGVCVGSGLWYVIYRRSFSCSCLCRDYNAASAFSLSHIERELQTLPKFDAIRLLLPFGDQGAWLQMFIGCYFAFLRLWIISYCNLILTVATEYKSEMMIW
jgi:hypothetical protein